MHATFTVRHLLLVSWPVPAGSVALSLPRGLEPALTTDGDGLVSLAAFRNEDVHVGGRGWPAFSQVHVRTYVTRAGEPGVLFLSLRVTPAGLGAALLGAPFRPARIRVREGSIEAPGLGLSFRYIHGTGAPDVPGLGTGPLGMHEVGYFRAAGLRRLAAEHDPFRWEAAELVGPSRFDPVLALGFEVGEPSSLLYAAATAFQVELPPRKVA